MQTHVKINRKVAFFIEYSRTKKSKSCCHPPFHPPNFCRHSLKFLSPTLPKFVNWILLSPSPLSSDLTTPQNLERAPGYPQLLIALIDRLHCVCLYFLQKRNEITSEFYQVKEDSQIDFATGNIFLHVSLRPPLPTPRWDQQ